MVLLSQSGSCAGRARGATAIRPGRPNVWGTVLAVAVLAVAVAGLGRAAQNVDVEIWWPTSDTRQRFHNVGRNQILEVTELEREYKPLRRVPQPLRGGTP